MLITPARRAVCAAIAFACLTSASLAESINVTQDINLTATVPASCTVGGSSTPTALAQTVPIVAGQVDGTQIGLEIPLACNTGVQLDAASLSAGMRGPTTAQGTANVINYTTQISGGGLPTINFDTTTATPGQFFGGMQSSTIPNGQISVIIAPSPTSLPLRAGVYTDTLRVKLTINQ